MSSIYAAVIALRHKNTEMQGTHTSNFIEKNTKSRPGSII